MHMIIPEQMMLAEVRGALCDVFFDYNPADNSVGAQACVTINRVMRNGKNVMCNMVAEEITELRRIALDWFCENYDGGDDDPMDYDE